MTGVLVTLELRLLSVHDILFQEGPAMTLELTDDQALVLFEWLSRCDDQHAFPIEDPAEERVLWSLHGQLEKTLSQQFKDDYRELVARARERVMEP